MTAVIGISLGAALGALLRWLFALKFNALYPSIPLGTLLANLVGGYLIGLALVFFAAKTTIAPEWRLFVVTGFLGGLTTFSTFSAEMTSLLQEGRFVYACGGIGAHVVGSLAMTLLGMTSMQWLITRIGDV
jgi:CrcB protein